MQISNKDMDYQLKTLKKQLIAEFYINNIIGIILKDSFNNYSIHEFNWTKTKLIELSIFKNIDNIKQYNFMEYILIKQYKTYIFNLKEV